MNERSFRQAARPSALAAPGLGLALLICGSGALLVGCGGSGDEEPTTNQSSNTPPVEPVVSMTDEEVIALNNKGVGLMGQFQYSDALECFQKIVKARPDEHSIGVNLAIATLNRQLDGDEARALEILEAILVKEPRHIRANYCAGLLKMYQGPPAEPFPHFKIVAEEEPGDACTAYLVGKCYENEGNHEAALEWFEKAAALDPYLNSANHRMSSVLYRMGRTEEGDEASALFQMLNENPRARTFEFAYMKMGPLGEAMADSSPTPTPATRPEGALFADAASIALPDDVRVRSMVACDFDGDGDLDLIVTTSDDPQLPGDTLLLRHDDGGVLTPDVDHELSGFSDVNAVLCGDVNNDGRTDVYLCRNGANILLQATEDGGYVDLTASVPELAGIARTVDGAMVDADHDGDLDIVCANADQPSVLVNNNLNGTWRVLGDSQGILPTGAARQIVCTDIDRDRDVDLLFINESPPHELFLNDRLWSWRLASDPFTFVNTPMSAAISVDRDADGWGELLAAHDGGVTQFTRNVDGSWTATDVLSESAATWIGSRDLDGDASPELVIRTGDGRVLRLQGDNASEELAAGAAAAAMANLVPGRGPSLLLSNDDGSFVVHHPGAGRFEFTDVLFSGAFDDGQSMRSNASGLGVAWTARVGTQWAAGEYLRSDAGPGQGIEPLALGRAGRDVIDFLELDWSDGVFQSELALGSDDVQTITETQRQLSSCPLLFAWNGTEYVFLSDLLGVGGMGFLVEPGVYAEPRPWESFRIGGDQLAPRDGAFIIKMHEAMEEACYLDDAVLTAWDLPPGHDLTVDDRLAVGGPDPTGRAIMFEQRVHPIRATDGKGRNVLDALRAADHVAVDVGPLDHRFIGRLMEPHTLIVEFDEPLRPQDGVSPTLVVDGWIEYPYSQTAFAAWQADALYLFPGLEARDEHGTWHRIHDQFGGPGGMPRQWSLPLTSIPDGTTALRFTGTTEIYWDHLFVTWEVEPTEAVVTRLPLTRARLERTGFPLRTTGPQRLPHYDYGHRAPYWDCRYLEGDYTRMGDVTSLVRDRDDAFAIFGPGEEVELVFDATPLPELKDGWTRVYVFDTAGWCKDMDLFTKDGETVGPWPFAGWDANQSKPERDKALGPWTTRYRSH